MNRDTSTFTPAAFGSGPRKRAVAEVIPATFFLATLVAILGCSGGGDATCPNGTCDFPGADAGSDSAAGQGGGSAGATGSGGAGGVKGSGGSGSGGVRGSGGIFGSGGISGSGGVAGSGGISGSGGIVGSGGSQSGCAATSTPVARHGQLRIQNGKLVNQCGRPVQLTAMSFYDWNQAGRQFYNATAVKNLVQEKKCASLRIPLIAAQWPSGYARVKTVMDACIANGIYCIPNWHVIGSSDVNNAKAFYVQLANDYGSTPNIIYEPWNEPTTATWPDIKSYMQDIIAAVRPIDPDGIFLSGDRQWDQLPNEACASPLSDSNVGYVFHFYAASHSLAGFQSKLDSCLNAGKLLWATEYGGCEASGGGTLNEAEVRKWWAFMDANNISSNAWALESNTETSSVFVTNASSTGPWPDAQLTYWGKIVFAHIAERYAVTMSQ